MRFSFGSKANSSHEDTEGEFQVPDPAKKKKLVAPLETTDLHFNDKLECNVGKVAASKPKKNQKSKHRHR